MMLGGYGLLIVTVACAAWASLATWSVHDPSLNNATRAAPRNLLGSWGAVVADLSFQSLGIASIICFCRWQRGDGISCSARRRTAGD